MPFDTGIILSMASSYAIYKGKKHVVWGATKNDSIGNLDYTPSFADKLADLISESTGKELRIHLPLSDKFKHELMTCFHDTKDLFSTTWSCKQPKGDIQCGECDACIARRMCAQEAGLEDKTNYFSKSFTNPLAHVESEDERLLFLQETAKSPKY
jgi:7-cyano-7-deazaguanine synthase